jgi:hypothetical protein
MKLAARAEVDADMGLQASPDIQSRYCENMVNIRIDLTIGGQRIPKVIRRIDGCNAGEV